MYSQARGHEDIHYGWHDIKLTSSWWHLSLMVFICYFWLVWPFNSQDLIVNILPSSCYTFPCKLVIRTFMLDQDSSCENLMLDQDSSCENLMLDQDSSFYLISLSLSLPVCWITYRYNRENFHVNHFWVLKS